jgi:DNA-binding IscR family transcriptional regulator
LSLAAKGVLAFVLTRPAGARVTQAELFGCSRDPMTVIEAAVKELARKGLVGTVRGRAGSGVRLNAADGGTAGRRAEHGGRWSMV